MADAKQVIYIQVIYKCPNISLLLNKTVTKFQRLLHILEVREVEGTNAETSHYKWESEFHDISH